MSEPERKRWRWLPWRRWSVTREVDEEFAIHVRMLEHDLKAGGLSEEEARARAAAQFGDMREVREQCRAIAQAQRRDERRVELVGDLRQDVRFALRQFTQRPGFAIVSVLVLALGIAASSAVLSVADWVLLRPLPIPDAERLVVVWDVQPGFAGSPATSIPEFEDWARDGDHFEALTAIWANAANVSVAGVAERVRADLVMGDFMGVLGVEPIVGRGFTTDEVAREERVALISEEFWTERLGRSETTLGSAISLDGNPHTVIGIMPARTPSLSRGRRADLWAPLPTPWRDRPRGAHFTRTIGRLAPGVSLSDAESRSEAMAAAIQDAGVTNHGVRLEPLRDFFVGRASEQVKILLGAVALVLLIVCANLASLFLARSVERTKEFAIRSSMGARKRRLARQLLTESLIAGVLGGALGLLMSALVVDLVAASAPVAVGIRDQVGVDLRVALAGLCLAVLASLLFGFAPVLHAARLDLAGTLRDSDASRGGGGRSAVARRRSLVAAELALSTMLLVSAGILARSFARALGEDPGVDTENILAAQLAPPTLTYPDSTSLNELFARIRAGAERLPGVTSVAISSRVPLVGRGDTNGGFSIEGREWPDGVSPFISKRRVSWDYFRTLGIEVVRGRAFERADEVGSRPVAVISRTMADTYWPDQNPIGARVNAWSQPAEIVGVVEDVLDFGLDVETGLGTIYLPYLQNGELRFGGVLLRVDGDPESLVAALRNVLRQIDPELPLFGVSSLDALAFDTVSTRRILMTLIVGFASMALVLAALGVFAVTAQSVGRRTHEIGIRMAIGARQPEVVRMVLRDEAPVLVVGILLGIAGAVGSTRLLASAVYGVSTSDPASFLAAVAALAVLAAAATWVPARRAARIDPTEALKAE